MHVELSLCSQEISSTAALVFKLLMIHQLRCATLAGMHRLIVGSIVILTTVGLNGILYGKEKRHVITAPANVRVEFDCGSRSDMPRQETLRFLERLGFKSRDMGPVRHEFEILAFDDQRHMMGFVGRIAKQNLHVAFLYKPPLDRTNDLEGSLISYISETISCRVTSQTKVDYTGDDRSNPDVEYFYRSTFELITDLVRGGSWDDWSIAIQ